MRDFLKNRVQDAGRMALQRIEQVHPVLAQRLRQETRQVRQAMKWFTPVVARAASQVRPYSMEFEPATLPWLDRPEADIEGYVRGLGSCVEDPELLVSQLHSWRRDGFVLLPRAIEPALIDALLADVSELIENCSKYSLRVNSETKGIGPVNRLTRQDFEERHFRILDFHNSSVAGKRIALHAKLVDILGHIFREPVVAMQSLTFRYGSEQTTHQDFPYVVSQIPSHLAATWVALEDVSPDAGPLGYYPGSHRLPKFDFGNGMFLTPESTKNEFHFAEYLEEQCRKAGLELKTYLPKKGDVFVWHGALAHRGTPQNNPNLTRQAFVTHYSTVRAYPHDRRKPGVMPELHCLNGGLTYGNPLLPQEEDIFTHGVKG